MLKMARITGLPDESEVTIYGASSLRTGALTAASEKISIGCLVKIEMNVQAGAIRMTTRTLFAAASTAVIQTAKSFLA